MLEPTGKATAELVRNKSRFLGYGVPAANQIEADAALAEIKEAHPDSSHVAYAALVGAPHRDIGSLSDAGEPKGTAGRPIMEILKGSDVRNSLIAVVRYFGGTKLGTGGLVRAYGDTARKVLAGLPTRELVIRCRIMIEIGYEHHDAFRRLLATAGAEVVREEFDTRVVVEVQVPVAAREEFRRAVTDISAGSARIIDQLE